jgi:hypothetical protein
MRKIALLTGAIALALPVPMALPTAASAADTGGKAVVNFCKEDVPNNQPAVLGDCVGFINTFASGSQGIIRFECAFLQDHQPDLFYDAYDSYDECIVDRASLLPPPPY